MLHRFVLKALGVIKGYGTHWYSTPERYVYGKYHEQDSLFPITTMSFEGHELCVPHDAHQWLTDNYGDYMQIPPPEKRRTHVLYFVQDEEDISVRYEG